MEIKGNILKKVGVEFNEIFLISIAQLLLLASLIEGIDDTDLLVAGKLFTEVTFQSPKVGLMIWTDKKPTSNESSVQ